MYTQCPHCKTTFHIDTEKLRLARGEVLCQNCHVVFNALPSLSESIGGLSRLDPADVGHPPVLDKLEVVAALRNEAERTGEDPLPSLADNILHPAYPGDAEWDQDEPDAAPGLPRRHGLAWFGGACALLAVLAWQMCRFEGERLAQNEGLRPWLELACGSLGCDLPPYRDFRQIQVIDRALLPAPGNVDGYEFSVILSNQSSLAQEFPSIKLALSGLNGRAIASRIFAPAEYLGANHPAKMPVGKPFEVRLLLAKPSSQVGGFSFELI